MLKLIRIGINDRKFVIAENLYLSSLDSAKRFKM